MELEHYNLKIRSPTESVGPHVLASGGIETLHLRAAAYALA